MLLNGAFLIGLKVFVVSTEMVNNVSANEKVHTTEIEAISNKFIVRFTFVLNEELTELTFVRTSHTVFIFHSSSNLQ